MSKKIPLYITIITAVLAVVVTFNASFLFFEQKYNKKLNETLSGYSYFDKLLSVDEQVKNYYIGEADGAELEASIIRGYLSGIGDDYSSYMTASQYADLLKSQGGNAVGIGINVIYDSDSKTMEIISVLPDSPAEDAEMLEGDIITAVDGKDITALDYYEALDLITGELGSKVKLRLLRDGEYVDAECERREVKTLSVTYRIFGGTSDVGFIRISEFNSTTPEQFKDAIAELQKSGCTKFVFDLRNNGGGDLNSIVETLDGILPEGPIAHIYYSTGEEQHYDSDASCLDAKIAVLTNNRTASAAELFASALKDYAEKDKLDAVIVGTKTFGKGVLQRYFQLKDGSAFKISVGKYDPPYSENYDKKGVIPDVEIELSEEASKINFYKLTDENDNQLIRAVEELNK